MLQYFGITKSQSIVILWDFAILKYCNIIRFCNTLVLQYFAILLRWNTIGTTPAHSWTLITTLSTFSMMYSPTSRFAISLSFIDWSTSTPSSVTTLWKYIRQRIHYHIIIIVIHHTCRLIISQLTIFFHTYRSFHHIHTRYHALACISYLNITNCSIYVSYLSHHQNIEIIRSIFSATKFPTFRFIILFVHYLIRIDIQSMTSS